MVREPALPSAPTPAKSKSCLQKPGRAGASPRRRSLPEKVLSSPLRPHTQQTETAQQPEHRRHQQPPLTACPQHTDLLERGERAGTSTTLPGLCRGNPSTLLQRPKAQLLFLLPFPRLPTDRTSKTAMRRLPTLSLCSSTNPSERKARRRVARPAVPALPPTSPGERQRCRLLRPLPKLEYSQLIFLTAQKNGLQPFRPVLLYPTRPTSVHAERLLLLWVCRGRGPTPAAGTGLTPGEQVSSVTTRYVASEVPPKEQPGKAITRHIRLFLEQHFYSFQACKYRDCHRGVYIYR